jgi:hypothetical protein
MTRTTRTVPAANAASQTNAQREWDPPTHTQHPLASNARGLRVTPFTTTNHHPLTTTLPHQTRAGHLTHHPLASNARGPRHRCRNRQPRERTTSPGRRDKRTERRGGVVGGKTRGPALPPPHHQHRITTQSPPPPCEGPRHHPLTTTTFSHANARPRHHPLTTTTFSRANAMDRLTTHSPPL